MTLSTISMSAIDGVNPQVHGLPM